MGRTSKRGKQKKVAVVPESNCKISSVVTVPENSPSVKSPKFNREDSHYAQSDEKDMKQSSAGKSDKITSYFPKSPESRFHQKDQLPARGDRNNAETVQDTMVEDSDASLPLLNLVTPDTTPTKECTEPPARSTQQRPLPSSLDHQPTPINSNPEERDLRPKAAQKLDYSNQVGREEGDQAVRCEAGNTTRSTETKEEGKPNRKGRGRPRKSSPWFEEGDQAVRCEAGNTTSRSTETKEGGKPNRKGRGRPRKSSPWFEEGDQAVRCEAGNTTSRSTETKEGGKPNRKGRGRPRKSRQAKQVQSPSVTLKNYFPVRRSNRKCKTAIEADEKKTLHHAVLSGLEVGVEVNTITGKGRGVIATKAFEKGDFVVEYYGDHIDIKTARERESEYAADSSIGCYMYYYQYNSKAYCVDATQESGRIGRLLNHSKSGNCNTKLISIDSKPHLVLVAAKPILVGEELVYDYGDRDKESLQSHPWLAL